MSWVDKNRKINNRGAGRLFGTREYIFTFSFRKIFQHGLCQLHLYSEKKKITSTTAWISVLTKITRTESPMKALKVT